MHLLLYPSSAYFAIGHCTANRQHLPYTIIYATSHTCRLAYFTAESTNKKVDFMKCLNSSYKMACLTCSFSDKELAEYIQFRKREKKIPKKFSVAYLGMQSDYSFVMSSDAHFSSSGELLDINARNYIWLGELLHDRKGDNQEVCDIEFPLSIDPLCALIHCLQQKLQHNFIPCVMVLAASTMTLHYRRFIKKLNFCAVPLAFGESGTGKTTALQCALGLFGAHDTRFYSKLTKEKILTLCSNSAIPLGVDDPDSKSDINRLVIDLFNGAKSSTVSRGDKKPLSTCIISANFTTNEQHRFEILEFYIFVQYIYVSPDMHPDV